MSVGRQTEIGTFVERLNLIPQIIKHLNCAFALARENHSIENSFLKQEKLESSKDQREK